MSHDGKEGNVLDPLLQSDHASSSTEHDEQILRDPASLTDPLKENNSGETTASKRKLWNSFLGAFLATGTQVASVISNEVIQIQERGCVAPNVTTETTTAVSGTCIEAFNNPFMSVWFNHSITGFVCVV